MTHIAFARLIPFGLLSLVLWLSLTLPLPAAEQWVQRGRVLVVGTDHGGLLGARAAQVEQLRREGRRVEIRGKFCLSSCTMFLGAGDVCVSPRTVFGFHGPSYYGRPLPAEQFDYWSGVMSNNYVPVLRATFMSTWRYRIDGYIRLTGMDLIRMGYRAC